MKAPLLKRDTEAFRALQRHIMFPPSYVAELEYSKNTYKPCFRGQFRAIAMQVDNSEGPPVKTRN